MRCRFTGGGEHGECFGPFFGCSDKIFGNYLQKQGQSLGLVRGGCSVCADPAKKVEGAGVNACS